MELNRSEQHFQLLHGHGGKIKTLAFCNYVLRTECSFLKTASVCGSLVRSILPSSGPCAKIHLRLPDVRFNRHRHTALIGGAARVVDLDTKSLSKWCESFCRWRSEASSKVRG